MTVSKFSHQMFYASNWEDKLKEFIGSIDCTNNQIWHRSRAYKKVNEELASLGYNVKFRYGENRDISFKLNKSEGRTDGWVFDSGEKIESVQIAIAFYESEEAEIDKRLSNGENVVRGGWVYERMNLLKNRVEKRVEKKTNMDYSDIDTLLIGVRDWFVYRIGKEYPELKNDIFEFIESRIANTNFKQCVIIDSDYVGNRDGLVVKRP